MSILLAIISSLCFGGSDFLGGYAAKTLPILRVLLFTTPAGFVVELVMWPFSGVQYDLYSVFWGVIAGMSYTCGFSLLYWCLAQGPIIIFSPISALVSAALPVLIGFFIGESLNYLADCGLCLGIIAVILLSLVSSEKSPTSLRITTLLSAIFAGAGIGIQLICFNQAPHSSGIASLIISRTTSLLIICIAFVFLHKKFFSARETTKNLKRQGDLAAIASGICDSCASIAFLLAVHTGELIIAAVITALYPAGTILLARIILHERMHWVQICGLVLAAFSIILLTQ